MRIVATTQGPKDTAADTVAVGVFEGEDIAHDVEGGLLQSLLTSGEAKRALRKLAVTHAEGKRWIVVGLGDRERFDAERARVAAAAVVGRAKELGTAVLAWEVPHKVDDAVVAGLVEGTALAAYAFTRYRSGAEEDALAELLVSAHHDVGGPVARAEVAARAANRARDLQNTPSNDMTPSILAERARELAKDVGGLEVEVVGREEIAARGMGAFTAVAKGSDEEPALITIRYRGRGGGGDGFDVALVGKAVTFDTGGISIKPAAKMYEMKFDMSGGAAVLEAMGAIAELALPVDVLAVIGATENMPSGHAVKPGDIVTAKNGLTIEINNTDAEGRLVLADCLVHATELGARRLVDVATLTGAVLIALGSTHTGLVSSDDDWAAQVEAAGRVSGELVWRLPLHEEYADAVKGRYADLTNSPEGRKAGSITAGEFLKRFTDGRPWAHLDVAGTASDNGRSYTPKGGAGVPVRLLVELVAGLA